MQALELPYRVTNVCTGDIGDTPAKKPNIEVWGQTLGAYGEVVSDESATNWLESRKPCGYN